MNLVFSDCIDIFVFSCERDENKVRTKSMNITKHFINLLVFTGVIAGPFVLYFSKWQNNYTHC